ncbi:MAG: transcription antitermination factor NusB [Anaeroplasmataceae bacterium]|nr:transcription antitermination factor NusB [Anaeroplasmataceae bacterium]MDE5867375.1 transcription antitermination factor NusB [Anaeroplasmataceae bacterium]
MRRVARQRAMLILYTMEVNQIDLKDALEMDLLEEADELAVQMATFCVEHLEEVDKLICDHLKNYTIERLNLVDLAIVRLAVSEMLGKEPREVIINEALELTKEFSDLGDHKATSFNNRLLDNINKDLTR